MALEVTNEALDDVPFEVFEALPKTDLHVHLDGSLRLETILDLAREGRIELPAHDAAGQKIARGIVPLAADGSPDPVNGWIVIMPVSVSNAYGAWEQGDAGDASTTVMTRANAPPA